MNLAALALAPAGLAGLATAWFLLEWTRAASASLPGLGAAGSAALPWLLLAAAAGAAAAGRGAARPARGPVVPAMRALAAACVAVLLSFRALEWFVPPGGELVLEGWRRTALAALPAVPALGLLGSGLARLTAVRQHHGLPPQRALGGVLAAAGAGAGVAAWLEPGLLLDGSHPALRAEAALLAAALGCGALALFEPPTASASPTPAAPRAAGSAVAGLLAALCAALVVVAGATLLRFALALHGRDLASLVAALAAFACGAGAGALLAGLARPAAGLQPLRAGLLLAVAAVALWLGPPEPRAALGLLGGLLGAAVVMAAVAPGVAQAPAWALACAAAGLTLGALATQRLALPDGELLRAAALTAAAASAAVAVSSGAWVARVLLLVPASALAVAAWSSPPAALPWRAADDEVALLEQLEDPQGLLALVSTADGGTRLRLDGWSLPSGPAGALAARRMARLSAAMRPQAESALLIGAGDGQLLLGLEELLPGRVECLEPLGRLVEQARAAPQPAERPVAPPVHADPRAAVAARRGSWDLVVVAPQPPGRLGAGARLAQEHLLALRRALRPGGVVVQWLPLHQMPWPAFASAARSFLEAFPESRVFLASLRATEPLVALVGALEQGLPGVEALDAFLGASPSAAGISGAADVFDLYVCDGWTLGLRVRDAPPTTLAHPLAELLSAGREEASAALAIVNLRRLAEAATPLDTVSLQARPVSEKETKELGAQLVARNEALRWLLVAQAARLERVSAPVGALSADERSALEDEQGAALLAAWRAAGGHLDVRQALLGFAAELVAERRWALADALLASATATVPDGRLLGLRAGVLIELGAVDEALRVGRQAAEAAPDDPNALANLARALLVSAQDEDARAVLVSAREAFAPTPLPPLHAACLALLEHQPDARARAEALLAQMPAGESWAVVLRRLIGA